MVRINPGSDVQGDNQTKNATPSMVNVDVPEPKMTEGKYSAPFDRVFNNREAYDNHAIAVHQPPETTAAPMEQPTSASTA